MASEGPTSENFMKAEKSNAFGGHIIEIPQLGLEKVYTKYIREFRIKIIRWGFGGFGEKV